MTCFPYVVGSDCWNSSRGSFTWVSGGAAHSAMLSVHNSLVGSSPNDSVGLYPAEVFADGNYIVPNLYWNNGAISTAGAITLASGRYRLVGTIQPWNSVIGAATNGGTSMTHACDANRHQMVVGRPAESVLSIFTVDQIFAENFEP